MMLRHCSGRRRVKRKREEKIPYLIEGNEGKRDEAGAQTTTVSKTEDLKPIVPYQPNVKARAIFILDNAPLRKGLVRKRWKILNSEEDADFLLKQKKNLNSYRPDIVHEALRAIFDSPLNKAGMVGAVFVKIDSGVFFEIKPHVRIPRTCKRFCGIMLELLEKSCIRTKDTRDILIHVIDEPITQHLPVNSRIIGEHYTSIQHLSLSSMTKACYIGSAGLSYSSEKLVDIDDYVSTTSDDLNLVFVVGTMVHGKINKEYRNEFISVSNYPLSAKCCLGLICEALEQKWSIF